MATPPILSYRDAARIFTKGGAVFVRQSGSHRIWKLSVCGVQIDVTVPAHQDGDDVLPCYISKARRRWRLTVADGVSDQDFYAGNWPKR